MEFILIIQIVLIVVILSSLGKIKRALWRVENEQESARKQNRKIKVIIEQLILNSKKSTAAPDTPVTLPTPQSAVAQQKAKIMSDVEIDIPKTAVHENERVEHKVTQAIPPPIKKESQAVFNNIDGTKASTEPRKSEPLKKSIDLEEKAAPIIENAREMLARMWWWFLVGEEHKPQGRAMEYAIASTWLTRMGIILLVTFIATVLKWSIDQNLMGPAARIAMSILFGLGMVIAGLRLLGKKYHLMGQGFLGGGILILYFSAYAAGPRYSLISIPFAFGLMILVTTAAWLIAIRVDSMLVAVLGIAGGFMTPILLSTGTASLPVLYSYMFLLNLGILAVSHSRQWPILNYLGFVLTYGIFLGSLDAYEKSDFTIAITFLSGIFVIHSVIVYLYNIRRRRTSNALEIIHLVVNGCLFSGISYWLIRDAYGRPYPSIMAASMAAFYIMHVAAFLWRKLKDRNLLTALIALSGAFTTWTLPLLFEKESLTIGFALLAATFLWIGRHIGSRFLRNISHLIYAVVFARLLGEMNNSFGGSRTMAGAEYWHALIGRLWTFGITIGSIALAFFLERRGELTETPVQEVSDTNRIIPPKLGAAIFFWSTVVFLFGYMHLEINAMFTMRDIFRLPALTVLWCGMGLYFLYMSYRNSQQNTLFLIALTLFAGATITKLLSIDLGSWDICRSWYYNTAYTGQSVVARLIDFGTVMAFLTVVSALTTGSAYPKFMSFLFGYAALVILFLYTTLELNTLLHRFIPDFQNGGITILWAVFAITFTGSGIRRNMRPLRYLGLALFAIVAGKIFLHDLDHMPMIFRVIAFFAVGTTLLLGAFAYIYAGRKFAVKTNDD